MNSISQSISEALEKLRLVAVDFFPKFIVALVILIIGEIFAKLVKFSLSKILKAIKLDALAERIKLDEVLSGIGIKAKISKILSSLFYWIILLVFIIVATDYLNIEAVSSGIKTIVAYVPTITTALIVFLMGMVVATLVKRAVYSVTSSIGLSGAQVISNIVYYLLAVLVGITAMNKAGIETDLISTYLIMIMGSMLLAFGVAYGIASKDLVGNILSSYYSKDKFKVGDMVRIGDVEGEIEKVDSMSIILNSGDKKVIVPSKRFLNEEVEILNSKN